MSQSLDNLLQSSGLNSADLWRASSLNPEFRRGTSTGFRLLDEYLPGGGWPANGVTELIYDRQGIGELRVLIPALARMSRQQARWILWVAPPYIPYAPALARAGIDLSTVLVIQPQTYKDTCWVLEKALESGSCSVVMAWFTHIDPKQIRRLQVASKDGDSWGILFRSNRAEKQASPAELRIQLYGVMPSSSKESSFEESTSLNLKIIKRRGGWATESFTIHFDDELNQVTPIPQWVPSAGKNKNKFA
ncbi:MAG: translesion DNA synthesis-associated protein ImuA [Pseudomonadales bacterium]